MSVDVEVVADVHAVLGEGPLWDAQRGRLLWLDIDAGALHGFDGREDHLVRRFAAPLAAACLAGGDRMLLGIGLDVVEAEIRDGGGHALRRIARAGAGDRINDGTCDPRGRFFFGTLSARTGGAALYRLDPDGGLTSVLEGTTISNGLDWSPDGASMYFVDTPTRTIDVYDSTNGEVIATIPSGTAGDVDRAVQAARAAFQTWSTTTPEERAKALTRVGEGLAARMDEIATATREAAGVESRKG